MAKKLITLNSDGKIAVRLSDGKVQPIAVRSGNACLLIDCSQSMSDDEKLVHAKDGAAKFAIDALIRGYSVGLIAFASEARKLCGTTTDVSALRSQIGQLSAGGSTNMAAALELAEGELARLSGNRVVIVATDGQPDLPEPTIAIAQRMIRAGIEIIAIGTEDADHEFLSRIASRSDLAQIVNSRQLASGISEAVRLLPVR